MIVISENEPLTFCLIEAGCVVLVPIVLCDDILSGMTLSPSDNDFDLDSGTNHDRA